MLETNTFGDGEQLVSRWRRTRFALQTDSLALETNALKTCIQLQPHTHIHTHTHTHALAHPRIHAHTHTHTHIHTHTQLSVTYPEIYKGGSIWILVYVIIRT